jgi:hypothetical protein
MGGNLLAGPGGGGLLDVLMPLGLGVASAAHPALARGASAITQSMAMAGRNKRLKELMDLQAKQEGRAEEQFQHQKSNWNWQDNKSRYSPVNEGGGQQGLIDWSQPTAPPVTVVPQYEGSQRQLDAAAANQTVQNTGYINRAKGVLPVQKEYSTFQGGITRENQNNAALNSLNNFKAEHKFTQEQKANAPITPKEAMAELDRLRDDVRMSMQLATKGMEGASQEEIQQALQPVIEQYQPHFDYWNKYLPAGTPAYELPEFPPAGFKPIEGMPGAYFNPDLPPSDPNSAWFSKAYKKKHPGTK